MSDHLFDAKDYQETLPVTFDFALDLSAGETIASPVMSYETDRGTDASPASLSAGPPAIAGSRVVQLVQGGVIGCDYLIRARVTTSLGRVLVAAGILPVRKEGKVRR